MLSGLGQIQPALYEQSAKKLEELEAAMAFTNAKVLFRIYDHDFNMMDRESQWQMFRYLRGLHQVDFAGADQRLTLIYLGPLSVLGLKHNLSLYPLITWEAQDLVKSRQKAADSISFQPGEVVKSELLADLISRPDRGQPILDEEIAKVVRQQTSFPTAEKLGRYLKIYQQSVPTAAEHRSLIANGIFAKNENTIAVVDTKDFTQIVEALSALCAK